MEIMAYSGAGAVRRAAVACGTAEAQVVRPQCLLKSLPNGWRVSLITAAPKMKPARTGSARRVLQRQNPVYLNHNAPCTCTRWPNMAAPSCTARQLSGKYLCLIGLFIIQRCWGFSVRPVWRDAVTHRRVARSGRSSALPL